MREIEMDSYETLTCCFWIKSALGFQGGYIKGHNVADPFLMETNSSPSDSMLMMNVNAGGESRSEVMDCRHYIYIYIYLDLDLAWDLYSTLVMI
jgi:hypothetical protein